MSDQCPGPLGQALHSKQPCPQCKHPLEVADFWAVGVGCSNSGNPRPVGKAFARCPKCKCQSLFEVDIDKMPLFSAVEWLFDAIASDDIRKYEGELNGELNGERDDEMEQLLEQDDNLPLASPDPPAKALDSRRFLDLDADEQTAAQRNFRSRQKRYQRKLAKPPKQKEVLAFLNTLDKTSMKLRSKSWRRFMGRLGIDLDATAGGLADD